MRDQALASSGVNHLDDHLAFGVLVEHHAIGRQLAVVVLDVHPGRPHDQEDGTLVVVSPKGDVTVRLI